MRRATLPAATVLVLLVGAAPAIAQPYFELVWSDTTGAGTPGGTEIAADPGDVVTLDILVHVDEDGLAFAGISIEFTLAALSNPVVAMCPTGCQGMTPGTPVVRVGRIDHIKVSQPSVAGPTTILLARIDFDASGAPGSVDPFFIVEVDGTLTADFQVNLSPLANDVQVTGPATIPALPGPLAPIGLALALALAARRALRPRPRSASNP